MQPSTRREGLIRHLEQHLGSILGGWSKSPTGEQTPFQVALFRPASYRGSIAVATVGLSDHVLQNARTGKTVRLELLMLMREADETSSPLPSLLHDVGLEMLARGSPIVRGDVIRLSHPIWPQSTLRGLYASAPAYFDESFAVCDLGSGARCAIAWLVPITEPEMDFVSSHGWQAFEKQLAAQDPDLLEIGRVTMAVC